MSTIEIIAKLRVERDKLNKAIAVLEALVEVPSTSTNTSEKETTNAASETEKRVMRTAVRVRFGGAGVRRGSVGDSAPRFIPSAGARWSEESQTEPR
jgi:hypothetical protein